MSEENPTLETQVNTIVTKMTQDDSGKWQVPEEVAKDATPELLLAAKAERRYRDTQSAFTKSRQELKELTTINEELTTHVVNNAVLDLTAEQKEELDDLRTSDPEAWRQKINEHEQTAVAAQQAKLDEFKTKGKQASALELRDQAFQAFTERTGITLTDSIVENDLPAAYSKQLADGTITFEQFLTKAETFLNPKKVIQGAGATEESGTDLSDLPGGAEPSAAAQAGDDETSYVNEVYQ